MAKPQPRAENDRLRAARHRAGSAAHRSIIASSDLARGDRELLTRCGFLRRLMKGWYLLLAEPMPGAGQADLSDLSADLFHGFLARYLDQRLGDRWCLSAESTLRFLLDPDRVADRIVALTEYGSTTHHSFPGLTKLTVYHDLDRFPADGTTWAGLRLMSPESALARLKPAALDRDPELLQRSVGLVRQWPSFCELLAREGRQTASVRLIRELERTGESENAAQLRRAMTQAGYKVSDDPAVVPGPQTASPRFDSLEDCRQSLLDWRLALEGTLPAAPAAADSLLALLSRAQEAALNDAVHSLRLSGFPVTRDMVVSALTEPQRAAADAGWPTLSTEERGLSESHTPPVTGEADPAALLALQGYVEVQRLVKKSIVRLLEEEPLARVLGEDLPQWHTALLLPAAEAGLENPATLGHWRTGADPGSAALAPDRIPAALDLLWNSVAETSDPLAAAHLAHLALRRWLPWESGNGRLARFVLNAIATAARQDWVVLDSDQREAYETAVAAEPARSMALALLDLRRI